MKVYLRLSLLFFVTAIGFAHAAPARPLYVPEDPPKRPVRVVVDLNGTAWLGKYNTINRIFTFEADGTLSYRTTTVKAKDYKNKGSWRVVGDTIYFEYFINPNQKLMEFRGTIKDANTIVGEATYPLTGKKAPQTMQRTSPEIK